MRGAASKGERAARGWVMAALCCAGAALHAADGATLQQIQALIEQNKFEEALRQTEGALQVQPDDVSLRFFRGLVLTRLNRLDDAAKTFEKLTDDHPELPEPYNNLAVVYAAQGDYEKARQALQKAINTHPSYATAHENLGDIYAKMASQAYNHALELKEDNPGAKAKLAMIEDLFSVPPLPAGPAIAATEAPPAAAAPKQEPPAPVVTAAKEEPAPAAPPATTTSTLTASETAAAPPAESPPAPVAAPPVVPARPAADHSAAEVRRTVDLWATAWSSQDVQAYLSLYASDFAPEDGTSRATWAASRTARLKNSKFIKVEVADFKSVMHGDDHAQADFTQRYRSDSFNDVVRKTLLLRKIGDQWLIVQEVSK